MKGKRKVDLGGASPAGLTHNPFAGLRGDRAGEVDREDEGSLEGLSSPSRLEGAPRGEADRWLVRKERKGRGGKVVTIVSPLGGGGGDDLAAVARALGQGLGTGARAKDGVVVVQGELSGRVAEFLEATGAKVTVGS